MNFVSVCLFYTKESSIFVEAVGLRTLHVSMYH